MTATNHTKLRVVVCEGSSAEPFSGADRFELAKALLVRGYAVSWSRSGEGSEFQLDASEAAVVLGRFGGKCPPADQWGEAIQVQDISGGSIAEVLDKVEKVRGELSASEPGMWTPWFPVIDYARCTNCMQCLSFCLFGVYGVDQDQRIEVQNSDQCKTNCPACSRVCPEAAIIFPKYKSGPINGAAVQDSDLEREKMKIDISSLLGGDVYQMLRQRSERAQSRFSKERDPDKALNERQKCLTKLVQEGDIPPEVLMSLPSPEEIQRRAEEAKARAEEALSKRRE